MYSNKENANILTALLLSHEVRHIVVCPGSRNAALVHNFSECPDIICHSITDERSAGFFALGLRQQLSAPVAVCVTSGSAVLNLLPAVAEATYRHQGIIVISADRPAAWIGQMDGQTLPQEGSLGSFAAMCVNVPEPCSDEQRWMCNRLINDALMENERASHPSVHINVQLSEPLFDFTCPALPSERVIRRFDWNSDMVRSAVIRKILASKRPLVVIGQLPEYALPDDYLSELTKRMVVLAEPLSGRIYDLYYTDQMVASAAGKPEFQPDCVVFIGGNTVSKRLRAFLRTDCAGAFHITVSEDGSLHDISCHTSMVVEADPGEFVAELNACVRDSRFDNVAPWRTLREGIAARHAAFIPEYSQTLAVKLLEGVVCEEDTVHYANSMSVRLAALYARHYCWCNRGLNGIEGSLSTACGAAAAMSSEEDDARLYCVTGDLSFFYDHNALWSAALGGNLRIMLLNNGQGGIFKGLRGLGQSPAADGAVAGKHSATAGGICASYGMKYIGASDRKSLERGIASLSSIESDRPVLLEVFTDPAVDQQVYDDYYSFVCPKDK